MEFDPNSANKFPHLSGNFPENPNIKSEVPIILPPQQTSILEPSSPNNTFYNKNNFHHFQHYYDLLNGTNHHHGFLMMGPSSSITNYFSMFSNPSSGESLRNIVKIQDMHGHLNNENYLLDFSKTNPIHQCGVSSQPHVGLSLYPPVIYASTKGNYDTEIVHRITTKAQWTEDEDRILIQLVNCFGPGKWSLIAELMKGRVGKQCRDRWNNHLRPNIKKDSWTNEEDKILIEAHKEVGNKWTEIAKRMPGRTENTVKNHWNATKRRKTAKKQSHMSTYSNGTLLHNYIMQVTKGGAEKELNKTMSNITLENKNCNDVGVPSKGEFTSMDSRTMVYGQHQNYEVGWNLQHNMYTINRNGVNDDDY
ncbi:hypothetical protein TanjilG_21063 [Lupinus angustifolius]|uniref:Uncharacterized protein n=1 Tax=Lupinus angustifolius TaxID=3871 RepID=A0A1J7I5H2_LUPAN|nr:PREDICTED: myb protein-like [Lupinus angustifolius]OIW08083.1 hypothetical protein TanjilG_21063 [Lupinus angustifolius]